MNVAILVPRRAGVEERDRLWAFARTWWANDHPDWPIVEGHHDVGPFNRSAAINTAAREAGDWDVAVIIDADILCDPHAVRSAVDIAGATDAMVLAGDERVMLSRQGTHRIVDEGYRGNWRVRGIQERVYTDGCSCCVAVSRSLWDRVGGFDEMFSGWGWEDIAFRVACETLSGKPMVKLSSAMFHLWHTTSHENNPREATYKANLIRGERYNAARGDVEAVEALLAERDAAIVEPLELGPTRIPRIFHCTVPAETSEQIEHWWTHLQQLHPGWEFRTYREPIDPTEWPLTGVLWDRCQNGAQKAGLIRLEALVTHGGVYVDSDVEPIRSLEPLLHCPAFAGWEDETTVPDAVLGAEPQHPAFVAMIEKARAVIQGGGDAWQSGPGVTTETLPGRSDVVLLPPGAFYPWHYLEKHKSKGQRPPFAFLAHHWHGSWLTPEHKASIQKRQRR